LQAAAQQLDICLEKSAVILRHAMKLHRRQFLHLAVGAAALSMLSCSAWAQGYPTKPVNLIVTFPAGSAPDIIGRLAGQWLSERLSQQFVIENKPGFGGNIATEHVVNSPADGYTILRLYLPLAPCDHKRCPASTVFAPHYRVQEAAHAFSVA
jgi:tripartite-type tricarboxylate transporter receptor subunit TctC